MCVFHNNSSNKVRYVHELNERWKVENEQLTEGQMDGGCQSTGKWLGCPGVWHVHTAHVWIYHVRFRTVKIDVYDWDRDGR